MKIGILNKSFLKRNIKEFININRIEVDPRMFWNENNFLLGPETKWKYSIFAKEEKQILGYIIASKNNETTVHLHLVMTSNKHRNKNICNLLMLKIEGICKDNFIKTITLWIYEDLPHLSILYNKMGYNKVMSKINSNQEKLILLAKQI